MVFILVNGRLIAGVWVDCRKNLDDHPVKQSPLGTSAPLVSCISILLVEDIALDQGLLYASYFCNPIAHSATDTIWRIARNDHNDPSSES